MLPNKWHRELPKSKSSQPKSETCSTYYISLLFRIVGYGISGCDPKVMGIGPVPAIRAMMAKAGKSLADVDQGRNSIGIFVGPESGPEPACPSHVWRFETCLNLDYLECHS